MVEHFRLHGPASNRLHATERCENYSKAWTDAVIHSRLHEQFAKRGITGYRLRPATVRFRDGHVSQDYSELIVTGWAGVAPPESGIELTDACTGCGYKKYSALPNPEKTCDHFAVVPRRGSRS
jgi:hypothetical protein